ncbi:hypothetical protein CEXT_729561 [Caerostris extrusa]|uniref:Uncharacterized protein n=1 Tax=Caerostris extrusa TaxID=172846 RepID=A0AAV4WQU3_CAEEX|nr:hypothetical protein CEXT_729561 [Caerostris extrusa]
MPEKISTTIDGGHFFWGNGKDHNKAMSVFVSNKRFDVFMLPHLFAKTHSASCQRSLQPSTEGISFGEWEVISAEKTKSAARAVKKAAY